MADVQQLLRDFIASDRAGDEPDPLAYLQRVRGVDRAELEALIDGYLSRAPRRPFDEQAYRSSPARPIAEGLARSVAGQSGLWPSLLPRLRHRGHLKRAELVARLAQALGVSDRADKVGAYYHAMEVGSLPADGVSDRVLQELGRIVGEPARKLREAGRALATPGGGGLEGVAFSRVAEPDPAFADDVRGGPEFGLATPQRDVVDELFTGGPSAG
jgi:hypothetical protein